MLMLALALIAQDAPLPPVSPGVCRAAVDKLEPVISSVRGALEEEDANLRAGRQSKYSADRLKRMMDLLEADAANIAKVKRKYGNVTPTSADTAKLDGTHSPDWAKYVKACAA